MKVVNWILVLINTIKSDSNLDQVNIVVGPIRKHTSAEVSLHKYYLRNRVYGLNCEFNPEYLQQTQSESGLDLNPV